MINVGNPLILKGGTGAALLNRGCDGTIRVGGSRNPLIYKVGTGAEWRAATP